MSATEKVNILMVDDHPDKLLTYEVILSELGENLIKATSGREALEQLLKNDIAVVLLDVSMPIQDGFELANVIRQHPRFDHSRAILFVLAITLASANLAVAAQKEKVLYRFDFKNGADPNADLIQDTQGNLYGVTNGGGQQCSGCAFNAGCGIVFELSPSAEGGWTYSVLYAFKGGTDSANPSGRLIFDTKGNLYGAAGTGGVSSLGTIFELTRGSDGTWTENIVHSFPSSANDGFTPAGDLAFDANGSLQRRNGGGETQPKPDNRDEF